MTIDEARALAAQIAEVLRGGDVAFVRAIQVQDGEQAAGTWHANGNHASLASMCGSVLAGIARNAAPDDCEVCNAALASMTAAAGVLAPPGAPMRTCH